MKFSGKRKPVLSSVRVAIAAAFLVSAALVAAPASAHHAFAAEFDVDKPVTLSGTVVQMEWINPHAWIHVAVVDEETGDTAFLEETLLADMQQYEELNRTLVVDRNHRWLDRIEELLTHDDDYLIVVGALHLVGEDGVPALLDEAGLGIQQLREAAAVR